MRVTESVDKIRQEFGESFVCAITASDYDRVHETFGWTEGRFARILAELGAAPGNLTTRETKRIRLERLESAGLDLETLTYRDYPTVRRELGWTESTFKSALQYLGRDTGNLRAPRRTYNPTPADIEALSEHVSAALVRTLMLTGCRFGELWRMSISDGELTIWTEKGGDAVHLVLDGMPEADRSLLESWVATGSSELTKAAARKRWQRATARGYVSGKCCPHAFRHRAATRYLEAGVDTQIVAEMLGHKSPLSTRRYHHSRNGARAAEILR